MYPSLLLSQGTRLKLPQQPTLQKLTPIFLLLTVLTSTDSFLLYYQQSMAKRIIQPLHQPRLQYQLLMLRKLSERMGVMAVGTLMAMVKDVEMSGEVTERYAGRLVFVGFRWAIKVFNPSFWPESLNRQKLSLQLPNQLLHHARAIEELYHGENQYRYLNWKLQKGTSLFQGRFQTKKVRFQSQNSYMMVLLIISQQPMNKIIYGNLKHLIKSQKTTNPKLDPKHDPLAMLLYVLIENKLLIRRNNVEDKYSAFSQSQQIEINKGYSIQQGMVSNKGQQQQQQVVVIRPSAEMSKNLQQSSVEKGKIMKDRQKLIQAVLVKVMKHSHATRDNSVTFSQLYQAIRDHPILGGFNFSQVVVKQRLEQLIARQYCIRDQDDRKVYHYVA